VATFRGHEREENKYAQIADLVRLFSGMALKALTDHAMTSDSKQR
jgi:hypothetical protein